MTARDELNRIICFGEAAQIEFTAASSMLRDLKKRGVSLLRIKKGHIGHAESIGWYDPSNKLIGVNRGAENPRATFWHEAGHALATRREARKLLNAMERTGTAQVARDTAQQRLEYPPGVAPSLPSLEHVERRASLLEKASRGKFGARKKAIRAEEVAANHRAISEMRARGSSGEDIAAYRKVVAPRLNTYRAGYRPPDTGAEFRNAPVIERRKINLSSLLDLIELKERDYAHEYASYHSKPKQIARRAGRNAARSKMVTAGRAHKGDGKDVDHGNRNPRDNRPSNLRVTSKAANRSRNQ